MLDPSFAKNISNTPPADKTEFLFFNIKEFLVDLIKEIDAAQSSIDIEMFIFEKDELSGPIIESLKRASERNLKIRILVDGVGSLKWISGDIHDFKKDHIQVRVFNPLKLKFYNSRVNKRDHRKTVLIDNSLAYVGSFNFSIKYAYWRETILKIENPLVLLLYDLFSDTWYNAQTLLHKNKIEFKEIEKTLLCSDEIYTTQTRKLRKKYGKEFIKKMDQSQHRIWFTSPYFNPPRILMKALSRAAKRGVDVKLILPQTSDIPFLNWMAQLHYPFLIQRGIHVYEYLPNVLHAKTYLMDDEVLIGTGNLNYRSFYKDIELNIAVKTPHIIQEIEAQFQEDIKNSSKVTGDIRMPWYKRIISKCLSIFKTSF